MDKLLKIRFISSIVLMLVSIMFFPLGLFLIFKEQAYISLFLYLLFYIGTFKAIKREISKIDTIEIKIG
jgi:hypothetical protein